MLLIEELLSLLSERLERFSFQLLYQWSNCCSSKKCTQGQISMHEIFAVFIYLSYLFYLGHPSLLGFQAKTKRKSNYATFLSFKPGDVNELRCESFVYAICKCSKCTSCKKWHILILLDQLPCFIHHSIALVLLYSMSLKQVFPLSGSRVTH